MSELTNLETMPQAELQTLILSCLTRIREAMHQLIPALCEWERRGIDMAIFMDGLPIYRRLRPAMDNRLAMSALRECLYNEPALKRLEKLPLAKQEEIVAMKSLPVYNHRDGSHVMVPLGKMNKAELEQVIDITTGDVRPVAAQKRWQDSTVIVKKVAERKRPLSYDPQSNTISCDRVPVDELLKFMKTQGLR